MRVWQKTASALAIASILAQPAYSLDLSIFTTTINPAVELDGPKFAKTAADRRAYGTEYYKTLIEEAHALAFDKYKAKGDNDAYNAFMAMALTVPMHEGLNIQYEKVANSSNACRQHNIEGKAMFYTSKSKMDFFLNPAQQRVVDADVFDNFNQDAEGNWTADFELSTTEVRNSYSSKQLKEISKAVYKAYKKWKPSEVRNPVVDLSKLKQKYSRTQRIELDMRAKEWLPVLKKKMEEKGNKRSFFSFFTSNKNPKAKKKDATNIVKDNIGTILESTMRRGVYFTPRQNYKVSKKFRSTIEKYYRTLRSGETPFFVDCDQTYSANQLTRLMRSGFDATDVTVMMLSIYWHEKDFLAKQYHQSLRETIKYGLKHLMRGFSPIYANAHKYNCVTNYENLVKGTWAGKYNTGNILKESVCRFASSNNEHASKDNEFAHNLAKVKSWTSTSTFGFNDALALKPSADVARKVNRIVKAFNATAGKTIK